ncbi:uncharacterized protein LOC129585848 [Paramacrobiotus metropolitanus]|uniref:uncharacterized protein LOC129585848 n=1 Tax=Paramacrobiotus metropolitanus TaxID=2943436 RepID=UPI002445E154|nr:uncharacterized protein LOC129585848 [Paramacrobiotus metropolitanus]
MADPFYINRGEVKHHLSRLASAVEKFDRQAQLPTSPTHKENADDDVAFDKGAVQDIIKMISELENNLKELNDTFAMQSQNAKVLGLNMAELAKRKDIVEVHQREFDGLRDKFAFAITGDASVDSKTVVEGLFAEREGNVRRHLLTGNKENLGYMGDNGSQNFHVEPSRTSMHEMKHKREFADEDDDDLVEVYTKKNTATIEMEDTGKPYLKRAGNRATQGRPVADWMNRNFPLSRRRNRIIFFSFPFVLVLLIIIIIIIVRYS